MPRRLISGMLILIPLAAPALAGGNGIGSGAYFTPDSPAPRSVATPGFNTGPAEGVDAGSWAGGAMQEASQFCAALADPGYQIDCLAERIDYIAWKLDKTGPYAETRGELLKAARDLQQIAQSYRDPARPARRYQSASGKGQQSTRPVVAVRPESRAAAVAAAGAVLARTETVLLRSSRGNPTVSPQITRIAAAVGSNKVLLRST